MAPCAGDLGQVPDFSHRAMGNILREVVGGPGFGDLDGAGVSAAAVEGMASKIVGVYAVDVEVVVVETGNKRRCGHGPDSVRPLHHVQLRIAPEIQLHGGGAWGLEAELRPAGG